MFETVFFCFRFIHFEFKIFFQLKRMIVTLCSCSSSHFPKNHNSNRSTFFFCFLLSDLDYLTFNELYCSTVYEDDPLGELNLYQKRLMNNRHRENGSAARKLAVKLVCTCGRTFSYLAGYRYHR